MPAFPIGEKKTQVRLGGLGLLGRLELVILFVKVGNDILDLFPAPLQVQMTCPALHPCTQLRQRSGLLPGTNVDETFVAGGTVIFIQHLAA